MRTLCSRMVACEARGHLNLLTALATVLVMLPVATHGQQSYLLVSDYDGNSVLRYNAVTGVFVDEFVPKHSGGLNQPEGLIFGPHDNNLYAEDPKRVGKGKGA